MKFTTEFLDNALRVHRQKYGTPAPNLDLMLKNEYERGFKAGMEWERRAHDRDCGSTGSETQAGTGAVGTQGEDR